VRKFFENEKQERTCKVKLLQPVCDVLTTGNKKAALQHLPESRFFIEKQKIIA